MPGGWSGGAGEWESGAGKGRRRAVDRHAEGMARRPERGSGTGDVSRNCWERRAGAVVNALGGMGRRKMK